MQIILDDASLKKIKKICSAKEFVNSRKTKLTDLAGSIRQALIKGKIIYAKNLNENWTEVFRFIIFIFYKKFVRPNILCPKCTAFF